MNDELKLAMVKARVRFMKHPETLFLSTVCFMLKLIYDDKIGTGATNGTELIISPKFFMTLNEDMRVTLLAHETFHVVLQHCMIMSKFTNKKKFNHAADYVINIFLVEAGFMPIEWVDDTGNKHKWLYDPQYKGMSTEEVYKLLPDDPASLDAMGGSVVDVHLPPGGSSGEGESGKGDMTQDEVGRAIINIINTAAAVAVKGEQPGSVPADIQVFLENLKKPKLPLAHHLRKFFRQLARNDYTWRRPNKRFMPMIMPAIAGEKLTEIAFAYDMSGSVSNTDTTRYQSELVGVLRFLKPDSLRLVQFDTEIKADDRIKSLQQLSKIKLIGRGGTRIDPLMEWAKLHRPTALVVFTDGEYAHPSFNPGVPVLWVIHGRSKDDFHCNFGTIIRFEV